ncbi:pyridoxamine 5'-phosphate oxidase [Agaribacterium sp. ZY112]|uniref:pyridoxamine 5'-phosphate oxidase n=1 Tax=Agaribacterium sp. ZY112 TaxID=3233574 RepID=UPI0035247316
MDLESIRREYIAEGLSRERLADEPLAQFELWMQQAIDAGLKDPTAMTLATVDAEGWPNQRIVLLKHFDEQGFVFFTNYASNKSKDLELNPKACAHFPWHMMERQVKVQGRAEKISHTDSLRYFLSRPRESQLAAWASKQSHRINSRQFLLSQFDAMKRKFAAGDVPLPDFWGGYRIVIERVEFWQGRENRLHDRFQYSLNEGQWQVERLAP